jgi:large subunit ribosomal protein L18e
MKSKTKIDKQLRRKKNPEIVETIIMAKKNDKWLDVARLLSQPRSNLSQINLDKIEGETEEGDTILIPGKVLGEGEVSKKIRVVALGFSNKAMEKLGRKKCEIVKIKDEIKKNGKFEGVKIIK